MSRGVARLVRDPVADGHVQHALLGLGEARQDLAEVVHLEVVELQISRVKTMIVGTRPATSQTDFRHLNSCL